MREKVVILTAGSGSRLNERTRYFNKSLLKIGDQAAISHIIDLFPRDTEFVIALGHLGEMVRQYLALAHPDHRFTFVEIDKYSVPGSGPAYALNKCRDHLQESFYFVACDTLISYETFREVKEDLDCCNYILTSQVPVEDKERYCTVEVDGYRDFVRFHDKSKKGTTEAFIGFAHIENYDQFWEAMESNKTYTNDELQLAPALAQLDGLFPYVVKSWHDIGTEQGLLKARQRYDGLQNLDKADEELYLVGRPRRVVKYFHDRKIVSKRMLRCAALGDKIPTIRAFSNNFYTYDFVLGKDMWEYGNLAGNLSLVLLWAQNRLWQQPESFDLPLFRAACKEFYEVKTHDRLWKFFNNKLFADGPDMINNRPTQSVMHYLGRIDWRDICYKALPSGFHGDFQPGNIVLSGSSAPRYFPKITLIDWRQDFGGILEYGDRYYDFAKMWCSLLMPHPSIKDGRYSLERSAGEVFTWIDIDPDTRAAQEVFKTWVEKNYSFEHVELLAAIVMLNMAPLHEHPLDQWLYYTAKHTLSRIYGN